MARVTSDRALFGTRDGRVVEQGDPDAVVQLASRAGKELPEGITKSYPIAQYMKDNPLKSDDDEASDDGEKRQRYADKQRRPQADK